MQIVKIWTMTQTWISTKVQQGVLGQGSGPLEANCRGAAPQQQQQQQGRGISNG
jgi:hypothetical protein